MSSGLVVLTLPINTNQLSCLTEGKLTDVLNQLSPAPKISLLTDCCPPKFKITVDNKETAKRVLAKLQRSKIDTAGVRVLSAESAEFGAEKQAEGLEGTGKEWKPELGGKRNSGSTDCTNSTGYPLKIGSSGFKMADFCQTVKNKNKNDPLDFKCTQFKENKGKSSQIKDLALFDSNEPNFKPFNEKSSTSNIKTTNLLNAKTQNHKKTFIKLENLDIENVDSSILFNLIGIVGNVIKMLFNPNKGMAIAELEQESQATLSCQYLNNTCFFNTQIRVTIYPLHLNWTDLYISPDSSIRVIKGNSKYYRYKPNLNIKVNRPSRVIHMTNVASSVTLPELCKLFSTVNEPCLITRLEARGKKSGMYLMEFRDEKEGLEVLTTFHDQVLSGLRLKLSFSHMKIEKSLK